MTQQYEKEMTTVIPKGPRAGEKVTKKQKIRIGKAFDMIGNVIKQYEKANEGISKTLVGWLPKLQWTLSTGI
jgi:hypothetical protein